DAGGRFAVAGEECGAPRGFQARGDLAAADTLAEDGGDEIAGEIGGVGRVGGGGRFGTGVDDRHCQGVSPGAGGGGRPVPVGGGGAIDVVGRDLDAVDVEAEAVIAAKGDIDLAGGG